MFQKSDVEEPISESPTLALEANDNGFNLGTIFNFIVGYQDIYVDLSHEDRVPKFWSDGSVGYAMGADVIVVGVGVCFGAIHCIAWDFSFPTHVELLTWRILCVAITTVPIYMPLITIFLGIGGDTIAGIVFISAFPAFILYILARVFTLALALTSLRDLPTGAFNTVHWTTIPHV